MNFQDQSHINKVRDALWESPNGNASVMIGSGFSRNALPTQSKSVDLPTWQEVGSQLYGALYPRSDNSQSDRASSPGTEGMLRTAQEYQAAFGRTALHGTLRRLVQEEEYNPGTLHKRLLRLPWRDIYTTNWDTLLERTIASVPERSYWVIRNMGEIPMASQPRIVKLHGTFGSQYPLIVTEEDYRTYPKKYAPFVNTVQQAMMETVFCLIGFSGDDPNFLSWSGWVRDNLWESAPKIYLAGFLGLPPHRRRMLEDRNVVPIDLANHPQAHRWPPEVKHTLATEWLLHTLERGRPDDLSNWPLRSVRQVNEIPESIRELIHPVSEIAATVPMDEPTYGQISDDVGTSPNPADVVRDTTAIWKNNRGIYPGWLFAPNSIRWTLTGPTNEMERHILAVVEDLTTVERLHSLREVVWRKGILLDPVNRELESTIEETLAAIDCQNRTIDGEVSHEVDWSEIRQAWRAIAMELVTAARYRWDRKAFEARVASLLEFVGEDQDIHHGIIHERCLWALYHFDFEELDQLLSSWQTEDCDPVWMMRKFAVQSEAGRPTEAQVLLEKVLAAIRAVPINTRSIGTQSREGCALLCTDRLDGGHDTMNRLGELALLKCDPRHEIRAIEEDLRPNRNEDHPPAFGIGLRHTIRMPRSNYQPKLAAYRATRFSELAGLPPVVHTSFGASNLCSDILKCAATEVAGQDIEAAMQLVLRCCENNNDATLQKVVSRTRVATLTPQQAEAFAHICEGAIKTSLVHVLASSGQRRSTFWTERMSVAVEVLARLVLRLEPDRADTILQKALEYYENPQITRHRGLASAIGNLLEYSWTSLPKEYRHRRIFDLLSAPMAGLDGLLPAAEHETRDPAALLVESGIFPQRNAENEAQWQATINLIIRGLNGSRISRVRASFRAWYLTDSKLLTGPELTRVAEALWNSSQTPTPADDLPRGTGLSDFDLLFLPGSATRIAEERFLRKWVAPPNGQTPSVEDAEGKEVPTDTTIGMGTTISTSNRQTTDISIILAEVGAALHVSKVKDIPLTFSDEHRQYLAQLIDRWADTPVQRTQGFSIAGRVLPRPLVEILKGLPSLVEELSLSSAVCGKLLDKAQELDRHRIPALSLAVSLVGALPGRQDEIATSLRIGLTSSEIEMADDAATSLVRWLERSGGPKAQITAPPQDLVREIGITVASRRNPALAGALVAAAWIFEKGSSQQQETIRGLVQDGMNFSVVELNYQQERYDQTDIPLLRLLYARLAVAMAKAGLRYQPAVATWLASAYADPLPEIREAVSEFIEAEF